MWARGFFFFHLSGLTLSLPSNEFLFHFLSLPLFVFPSISFIPPFLSFLTSLLFSTFTSLSSFHPLCLLSSIFPLLSLFPFTLSLYFSHPPSSLPFLFPTHSPFLSLSPSLRHFPFLFSLSHHLSPLHSF